MPEFLVGAATFVVSLFLAYRFLRIRCRGIGRPFGPRARPWASLIVVGTAALSTGVGLLIVDATGHVYTAFLGVIVAAGLWFPRMPPEQLVPRTLPDKLTLPFRGLYDRMGEDMQAWCDVRIEAAEPVPQYIADAATYYHNQVRGRVKDGQARVQLADWQESITRKIGIARWVRPGTSPAQLREHLHQHLSPTEARKYSKYDPLVLADRLASDALSELNMFLVLVYQLGYHKLLIYPFRPPAQPDRARRPEPTAQDR